VSIDKGAPARRQTPGAGTRLQGARLMSDSTDEDEGTLWEIKCPNCWAIIDEPISDDTDAPQAFAVFTDQENGENYLPIFSDIEGAEDFIEHVSVEGKSAFQLTTPGDFLAVLIGVRDEMKVKNVGIDLICRPPKISGNFWPIQEAIETVQRAK
jgi:hypothetical protein